MGQFLAKPVTETFPEDHSNGKYAFGSSSMQGYRTSQEDAHTCLLDFDEGVLLAAVYDGHGGAEVAQYAAKKFPDFLKNNASYKNQQYEQALIEAFLEFDASLIREDVLKELKELACDDISEVEEDEDLNANLSELREEARMPIEQLLERFAKNSKKQRQSKLKAQKSIEESISSNKTDQCSSTSKTDDSMEPCSSSSKVVENGESSGAGTSQEEVPCNNSSEQVTSTAVEEEAADEAGCSSSADSKPNKEDEPSEDQPSSSNSTEEAANKSTASDQINEPSSTGQEKSKRIKPIKVSSQCSKSTFLQMLDEIDEEDDEEDESEEGSEEGSEEFYDSSSEDDSEGDESDDIDEEDDEEEEETADKMAFNGEAEKQRQHPLRRFMFDEGPGKDSGCTAVIALIKDNKLYVANAGDSRCVLSRAGQAIEMSHDHKPTNEIEYKRIKKAGGRVTNDGRVNGGLNLSRAFGDHSYKVNRDLPLEEQMITALPDIKVIDITDEDNFIVLACDGIWNSMSSREVVEYINEELKKEKKLSKICDSLFFKCLAEDAQNSDGSGCDNQTAIIIKLKDLPISEDNGEVAAGEIEAVAKSENNETKIVAELSEESNGKRKRSEDVEFTNGTEQSVKVDSPTSKKPKSELVE